MLSFQSHSSNPSPSVFRPIMCRKQPFFDVDHFTQEFFPKREYGILPPVVFGICLLTLMGTFAGIVLIRGGATEAASAGAVCNHSSAAAAPSALLQRRRGVPTSTGKANF